MRLEQTTGGHGGARHPLDVARLRHDFPAMQGSAVYLDGPGGSQVPQGVIDAVSGYLAHSNANTDGAFPSSEATDRLIADARQAAGDFLGVDSETVVFGSSTTGLNFQLAHAVARTLEPGDEIVTTELDHDANIAPWLLVARDHGLVVRTAPLRPEDGTLDYEALAALISDRTRVVACTAASNALGSITDLDRVGAAAREAGALLWVDAVHFAPHHRIEKALGADVLLTSAYKYFGPHLAVAAIRREYAETWPADRVRPAATAPPGHRFELGTLNHEALAGFVAAVEYIAGLGEGSDRSSRLDGAFREIAAHERTLTCRALERLTQLNGIRLYGIADAERVDERTPTLAFRVDGLSPRAVSERLADREIYTWDGNYYALAAMEALGLEESGGAVRAGFLHYTTDADVDRWLDALETIVASEQ